MPFNKTFFCSNRTQSCYLFRGVLTGENKTSWSASRNQCQRLGGDLVTYGGGRALVCHLPAADALA
jgi:hypothetical protein